MNDVITNPEWWKAAGIRALKTMAQTAVAMIGTTAAMEGVDWMMIGSTSLLAGIISVLTSIGGLPEVKQDGSQEEANKEEGC